MKNYTADEHMQKKIKRFKQWEGTEFEDSEREYYNSPHYNKGIFEPLKKEKLEAFELIGECCYNLAVILEKTFDYYGACAYLHKAYKHLPYNRFINSRKHKFMTYRIYENINVKGVKPSKRLYSVKSILTQNERKSEEYHKIDNLYIRRIPDPWGNF